MSYWRRLFGGKRAPPHPPEAQPQPPLDRDMEVGHAVANPVLSDEKEGTADDRAAALLPELTRLLAVGTSGGPSENEATSLFAYLRRTPYEGRTIDELVARNRDAPLPESLAVAAASALLDRGEPAAATKLLSLATSSHALLLLADLHAERGDFASAIATSERVLLQNLDHPGARERHRRWRIALGLDGESRHYEPATTTMVSASPEAPYLLLREVARGGAGAVYEAEDRELGRRIALKAYHDVEHDRAQLVHEARAAAELAGPGIVRVFDVDPEHGWLAIEWAALGALREAIRQRDRALLLPIEQWALPLASTLARIHAAGWVHHDVKPANVLFATPERPLLADFGTARRTGDRPAEGSLGYVSPERMGGKTAASPRDDVYGLGRVLEDVLDVLTQANTPADIAIARRWRPLAQACLAQGAARLADAGQVATRIRTELIGTFGT